MAGASTTETPIVRFGNFEVDPRTGELRRNGAKVRLQEQPFQILLTLLGRPGELVTRDELRNRLWPNDTFVDFDHSINAAVRRLRDALRDSAENPHFVETVARRGYRFLAPVSGPVPTIGSPAAPDGGMRSQPRWWLLGGIALAMLLLGIGLGRHAEHATAPLKAVNERRLTANAEELPVLDAAISPDGRYLAFADATGFYLRQIDTGETHSVVLPAGFDAKPRAWFPDGTHLLAAWAGGPNEPPSIWEISVIGGSPRKLVERGDWPAVSPDGSKVAFLTTPTPMKGAYLNKEIWIMRSDDEQPQRLIAGGSDFFGPPAWSPDGKRLAYVRGCFGTGMPWIRGKLEIMDLATRQTNVLTATPTLWSSVAWTPDWRLIFSLDEPIPNQNDSNLWTLPFDGAARAQVTATRLTRGPGEAYLVGVTADGKRLAFFRRTVEPDVYVTDLEAGGSRLTTPRRLTLDERADYPYSWTPDSKSVIFVSDRNGSYNIFQQRVDNPEPELLIGGHSDMITARLSPDERSILYLVTPPGGETPTSRVRLMRMALSGGTPQTVLAAPGINNQQCARLPSTVCIFSEFEAGRERFFTFDPNQGLGREIPKAEIRSVEPFEFNWSLSSDGTMLATARAARAEMQNVPAIRVLPVGEGDEKTIPVPGWAGIGSLDWAADSKSVWATGYRINGDKTLINVALAGKIRPMLEEKTMTLGWAIPSPDGKHLAIWKANGSSNVRMLENF